MSGRIEFDLIAEILDTVFSLAGKYGRWLNARRVKYCFWVWNVCTTYWIIRDIQLNLWSQGFFCLFSLGLNTWGYFKWGKLDRIKELKDKYRKCASCGNNDMVDCVQQVIQKEGIKTITTNKLLLMCLKCSHTSSRNNEEMNKVRRRPY